MDGINPTLAFAVLLLGLSGNARDAADKQWAESYGARDCLAAMVTLDQSPSSSAAPVVTLPAEGPGDPPAADVIVPDWAESATTGIPGSDAGDRPEGGVAEVADPITRGIVTAGISGHPALDPCDGAQ